MSGLPESWLQIRLGDVVDYGLTNKVEPMEIASDSWILELEDIEKDTSKILNRFTFSERQSKSTKHKFSKGDVLYGKLRPYLNKVVIAEADGYCTTEIIPIKPTVATDNRFVFYWLKHPCFLDYVTEVSHGLNMPRLGTDAGKKAPFLLAPLAEQKRIADKLDTLLSKVEATRTRLNYIPQLLKHFRQSVLTAATTGQLTEDWREQQGLTDEGSSKDTGDKANAITRDWHDRAYNKGDKRELKEALASIKTGPFGSALHKADYVSGGVPLINPMHINDGRITPSDNMTVNAEILERLTDFKVRFGDVVIGRRGEMGRCAVVGKKEAGWLCGTGSMVLTPLPTLDAKYLQMFLSSPETVKTLRGESVGSTMVNLNQQILLSLEIYFPSIKEQQEIIHRVETLFALADKIQARYQSAQAQVDKLTPALLAKAFQGKLLPQNPNDEPASTLLARLRAERENEPVKKWSRKVKALNGDAS